MGGDPLWNISPVRRPFIRAVLGTEAGVNVRQGAARRPNLRPPVLTLALLVIAALLACGSGRHPDASSHPLAVPAPTPGAFFDGVAWLPDGELVIETATADRYGAAVWLANGDGTDARLIALPSDPTCRKTQYQYATALSDGRLALTKRCDQAFGDPRVSLGSVVAYDFRDGTLRELSNLGDLGPNGTSWNTDASRGVGDWSTGVCRGIAWLTPTGPLGIPTVVSIGNKRMRLDDWLTHRSGPCDNQGRAGCPAWQPGGPLVAFFASPGSVGVTEQDRLGVPWQLYLMDSGSLRVTMAVSDIHGSCTGMSWSRDGRWLAFGGMVGGTSGIWLYSPASKALRLVSAVHPSSPVWSPDGTRLIAIEDPTSDYPPKTRLVEADVAGITHRS
jgi:hypothetical protein